MSVASNLRAAKAAIAVQERWTTQNLLNSRGQMCALGAVGKVLSISDSALLRAHTSAYDKLRHTPEVRLLGQAALVVRPSRRILSTPVARVYGLNDDGSHSLVMQMFDEAIRMAEQQSV